MSCLCPLLRVRQYTALSKWEQKVALLVAVKIEFREAVWLWAQVDDTEVINFLLSTEIIPLCLRTMEMGSELSKTVATFIVQKILLDDVGLNYICATAERFFAVGAVLGNMVRSGRLLVCNASNALPIVLTMRLAPMPMSFR